MRPHVARGAIYIVPLRIGGGTRLKIFEAMAMGKAVVSTTVGAEGLPVTDGEHVRLADEPAAFARAVVHLMRDLDERRRIEAAARALVVARYDWSAVAGEVVSLIRDAQRRDTLERAAHELVVAHYDWSAVAGQLEEALVRAATGRAAVAA